MKAVALVRERQALAQSKKLYASARRIPGVVDAYPSLGSHDGVVFVEARSLRDMNAVLHLVHQLPGVEELETLVEEAG